MEGDFLCYLIKKIVLLDKKIVAIFLKFLNPSEYEKGAKCQEWKQI
jgi:hypothetical protein